MILLLQRGSQLLTHCTIGREGGKSSHSGGRNQDNDDADSKEKGTQGGTPEQHAKAGQQSHKNK